MTGFTPFSREVISSFDGKLKWPVRFRMLSGVKLGFYGFLFGISGKINLNYLNRTTSGLPDALVMTVCLDAWQTNGCINYFQRLRANDGGSTGMNA